MNNENLSKQYNKLRDTFIKGSIDYNYISRSTYYNLLNFDFKGKKILDLACGDGYDLALFSDKGADIYGLDASEELIKIAKQKVKNCDFVVGYMENIPYPDNYFDVVLSKYALQTSDNVPRILEEITRVLKSGGIFCYLSVHPFRQFMEKKKFGKDYFKQEVVDSKFFEGKITIKEPSHTFNEYFSPYFFKNYRLIHFEEKADFPSSEKINGDTYPCFFVIKAEKY